MEANGKPLEAVEAELLLVPDEVDTEGSIDALSRRFIGQTTTIKKKRLFLTNLMNSGIVMSSIALAEWDRSGAYEHRHKDLAFGEAWELALRASADILEDEVHHRAMVGTPEPVVYQGRIQMVPENVNDVNSPLIPLTVRRKSDILLMFLLKGRRPERFREKGEVSITNNTLNIAAGEEVKQKLLEAVGVNI